MKYKIWVGMKSLKKSLKDIRKIEKTPHPHSTGEWGVEIY